VVCLLLVCRLMKKFFPASFLFYLLLVIGPGGDQVFGAAKHFPGVLTYRVRKGDSLWLIAHRYGVTVEELARVNKIEDPSLLREGRELRITMANYDYFDKHLQVKPKVKLRDWKYIVIHHSATDTGNSKRFDYFHRKIRHMPRGMAYHFVIGNGKGLGDGDIELGSRWTLQQPGGHVRQNKYNNIALGICLVGNSEKNLPTKKQIASLIDLVRYLQLKFSIPRGRVLGHREVPGERTKCPGRLFPLRSIRSKILP